MTCCAPSWVSGSAALFALALCAGLAHAEVLPRDDIVTAPTPQRFSVCHGNGCRELAVLGLTDAQWADIKALFTPPPRDAAEERARLRPAVALFERYAGAATGTWHDRGGTFNGGPGQMDCIDESINTTGYLTLLHAQGLMRFHAIADRATRGWFIFGWPHTTAVIRDTADGGEWVVDGWFLDNGEPPFVLPLTTWKAGWRPPRD